MNALEHLYHTNNRSRWIHFRLWYVSLWISGDTDDIQLPVWDIDFKFVSIYLDTCDTFFLQTTIRCIIYIFERYFSCYYICSILITRTNWPTIYHVSNRWTKDLNCNQEVDQNIFSYSGTLAPTANMQCLSLTSFIDSNLVLAMNVAVIRHNWSINIFSLYQ